MNSTGTPNIFNKYPFIRGLPLNRYPLNLATVVALLFFYFIYLSWSSVSLSEAIPWKLWSRPFSSLVDTGFHKKKQHSDIFSNVHTQMQFSSPSYLCCEYKCSQFLSLRGISRKCWVFGRPNSFMLHSMLKASTK